MIEIQPIVTRPVKKPVKIIHDESRSRHKQKKPKPSKQHEQHPSDSHIDEFV